MAARIALQVLTNYHSSNHTDRHDDGKLVLNLVPLRRRERLNLLEINEIKL